MWGLSLILLHILALLYLVGRGTGRGGSSPFRIVTTLMLAKNFLFCMCPCPQPSTRYRASCPEE